MQLNTYLSYKGNCKEAFEFYEKLLGGKILAIFPYAGSPAESQFPPECRDMVMHARMSIGDQMLMGSDSPPQYFQSPQGFNVSIGVTEVKEGERIFNGLAEGGIVKMPFAATFWAKGFGMCTDRFGIPWMVNVETPQA